MKPDPARPKNEPHQFAQHDQPYAWGRPPSTYLPFRAIIRATVAVSGQAWADHQWGDFVISGTGGWDWFSIQLDNNTELMLYVLRDRAGATSAVFGSHIMTDGTVQDIGPGSVGVEATGR
jgi:predicted secreted hydrolase